MSSADSIYFHNYVQLKNPNSSEVQKLLYTHTQVHVCIHKLRNIFVYTYTGTYMCIWLKSPKSSHQESRTFCVYILVHVCIHIEKYIHVPMISIKNTYRGIYICTYTNTYTVMCIFNLILTLKYCGLLICTEVNFQYKCRCFLIIPDYI